MTALVPFILGFVVGDLIWFTPWPRRPGRAGQHLRAACSSPLKYAGAAYLLWLGWKLWTAPVAAGAEAPWRRRPGERLARLFLGSLSLTLGNPKAMVFFIALLPSLVDLEHLSLRRLRRDRGRDRGGARRRDRRATSLLAPRARAALHAARAAMRTLNRAPGAVMVGAAAADRDPVSIREPMTAVARCAPFSAVKKPRLQTLYFTNRIKAFPMPP